MTRAVEARTPRGEIFPAYEIHMGDTPIPPEAAPFAFINGKPEGVAVERCIGTYLHGALENPAVVEEWLGYRPAAVPTKQQILRPACRMV